VAKGPGRLKVWGHGVDGGAREQLWAGGGGGKSRGSREGPRGGGLRRGDTRGGRRRVRVSKRSVRNGGGGVSHRR